MLYEAHSLNIGHQNQKKKEKKKKTLPNSGAETVDCGCEEVDTDAFSEREDVAVTVVIIAETEDGEVTDDSESEKQLRVVDPKDEEITVDELAFENQGTAETKYELVVVESQVFSDNELTVDC